MKADGNFTGEVSLTNGQYYTDPYTLTEFSQKANDKLKLLIKNHIITKDVIVKNCKVRNYPVDGIHVAWRMAD